MRQLFIVVESPALVRFLRLYSKSKVLVFIVTSSVIHVLHLVHLIVASELDWWSQESGLEVCRFTLVDQLFTVLVRLEFLNDLSSRIVGRILGELHFDARCGQVGLIWYSLRLCFILCDHADTVALVHELFTASYRLLIVGLSGAHVREGPGLLIYAVSNGRFVHQGLSLWLVHRQIGPSLLLLFGERYVHTVDCLLVEVTTPWGVLISVLGAPVVNTAVVLPIAVAQVIHISHVDLRLLNLVLNIFALCARRYPFSVPLIIKNLL